MYHKLLLVYPSFSSENVLKVSCMGGHNFLGFYLTWKNNQAFLNNNGGRRRRKLPFSSEVEAPGLYLPQVYNLVYHSTSVLKLPKPIE